MRKLILLSIILFGFTFVSNAQDTSEKAIGLRLGGSSIFGAEISYQQALWENNRLESNFGIRNGDNYDAYKLTALYQWVWVLDGDFNWYAGVGGGIGSYRVDVLNSNKREKGTFIFAAGNIGVEYNFDIPLQLSLDARPEIGFGNFSDNIDFLDIALGIRYRF